MQLAISDYFDEYFNKNTLGLFTYKGNVEIDDYTVNKDGTYYLTGTFDYENVLMTVTHRFRSTVKPLLGDYVVKKLEFYYQDTNSDWRWWELKSLKTNISIGQQSAKV